MGVLQGLVIGIQLFFSCVIGVYFLTQLKGQKSTKDSIIKDSDRKYEDLQLTRKIQLTEPLTEKMRPKEASDIIGQEDGMKALRVALCSKNPQHIIIYGSPGVGKTAAARIVLETAKKHSDSPFKPNAKFVEIDATTLRFDERSIADPLIGSVHDPIYQGAGAYGSAGVPQPKPGAVTKAHGGVLFIDEIGELHPVQMNKLLKVLEDRKVFFESAYYTKDDPNTPKYIHDVFKNGLPADFRLIGATTRNPEDIPPALRSRCTEIYFNDLGIEDIYKIVDKVSQKESLELEDEARTLIGKYALNGRDAIQIFQTAQGVAKMEMRDSILAKDIRWVTKMGNYSPRLEQSISEGKFVGRVNGLGVAGQSGMVLEVEAIAYKIGKDKGTVTVTGLIEEEELHMKNSTSKRKSMAYSSVQNVLTVLKTIYGVAVQDYYIHINFTSGIPIDGPSAGVAIFIALYSTFFEEEVDTTIAMTGEITIHGDVYPVGGVYQKAKAAAQAGIKKIYIPKKNMEECLLEIDIEIIQVTCVEELIQSIWENDIKAKADKLLHG